MIPVYYSPAAGFATLWPPRDLGPDRGLAVVATRQPAEALFKRAHGGWALWIGDRAGAGFAKRLGGRSEVHALADAAGVVQGGARRVVVLRSCGGGSPELFEKVAELGRAPTDALVSPLGVVLKAKLDPLRDSDFRRIARNLADQLSAGNKRVGQAGVEAFVARLQEVDWTKLDAVNARQKVLAAADELRRSVEAERKAAVETATPALRQVAQDTRASVRDRWLGHVGIDVQSPDIRAVEQIAQMQGLFVRDFAGKRNQRLTEQARGIIATGLAQGLGRGEIGDQLRRDVPDMWAGMGGNYAQLVAANAIGRARSSAQLNVYEEAGITYAEVTAMLDERTSDICRCMDGQIIPVSDMQVHAARARQVATPEAIKDVSPFMRIGRTAQNKLELSCGGNPIAQIERSGVGNLDDRGAMLQFVGGSAMGANMVGPPPYHHNCRTTLVPRPDISQVPRGMDMRAGLGAAKDAALGGAVEAPFAGLTTFASPSVSRPIPTGGGSPLDTFVVPGWEPPAFELGTSDTGFATRPFVASPIDIAFQPAGTWRATQTGAMDLVPPAADGRAAFLQVQARSGPQALSALVGQPPTMARQTLIQMRSHNPATGAYDREEWWQVDGKPDAPGWKDSVDAWRKAGSMIERERAADALIAAGQQHGWLKRADSLAGLSSGLPRGGASGGGPAPVPWAKIVTPGQLATAPAALLAQPQVGALGALKPAQMPLALAASPAGTPAALAAHVDLGTVAVQPEVYALRPSGAQMSALGVQQNRHAVWQSGGVAEDGSLMLDAKERTKWRPARSDGDSPVYPFATVRPAKGDKLVSVFIAADANPATLEGRYTLSQAITRQAELEHATARDWIVHSDRGDAAFVRFGPDAAKRLAGVSKTELQASLDRWQKAGDPKHLAAFDVAVHQELKAAYPKATVDWSQRNLIPGVPLAEQVRVRMAAVNEEIGARVDAWTRAHGRAPTDLERAGIVIDMVKEGASTVKASTAFVDRYAGATQSEVKRQAKFIEGQFPASEMADKKKPKIEVVPKKWADRLTDHSYQYCSNGLMQACAPHGAPVYYNVKNPSARAFHSPEAYARPGQFGSQIALAEWEYTGAAVMASGGASGVSAEARLTALRGMETVQHEVGHAIATVGRNGAAAEIARTMTAVDGQLVKVGPGKNEWALPGPYQNPYAGKLYGKALKEAKRLALLHPEDKVPAKAMLDFASNPANHSKSDGEEYLSMSLQHMHNPEGLAAAMGKDKNVASFLVSVLRGHYVPH